MSVSLLFPAFNRLEFTKQAWAALMANTDWSLVSEFHVYDDGSTDGTREWLAYECFGKVKRCIDFNLDREFLVDYVKSGCADWMEDTYNCKFHQTSFGSPMGVTLDWIKRSKAPMLAKLDNDTIYPPHWLNIALDVMERHPELDCLGLECMRAPAVLDPGVTRGGYTYSAAGNPEVTQGYFGYLPAIYVSGLGLYRRSAFRAKLPADNGYFGFEEFMQANCKSGWILPSLPVFLLDRMPMDPWKSLSEEYVRKGWQREWSGAGPLRYQMHEADKWNWWRAIE